MCEPRVGCGAVIVSGDRILLLRRLREPEAGAWGIAGGKVDLFEPVEDAMRREIREELGIDIRTADLLCVVDLIDRAQGYHWLSPVFLVTAYDGTPTNREPGKHAALDWFALDALPDPLTTPTRVAIAALRHRGRRPDRRASA